MHFTCNWVDLGWIYDFKKHVVQVKYLSHEDLIKKQVKKSCSLKLDNNLDIKTSTEVYSRSMTKVRHKLFMLRSTKSEFPDMIFGPS